MTSTREILTAWADTQPLPYWNSPTALHNLIDRAMAAQREADALIVEAMPPWHDFIDWVDTAAAIRAGVA